MKLAISQSNYIPWRGYFDLIASVDRFVLYDTVQFTKNDWRNRNLIKTQAGPQWLSIPVGANIHRTIQDVALPQTPWRSKHWKSLVAAYAKAPFFAEVAAWLEPIYTQNADTRLSEFNARLIHAVCKYLGITTDIVFDDGSHRQEDRVLKLIEMCQRHGADTYVSAPAGRNYISAETFEAHGVHLEWFDYPAYPSYAQLHGPFVGQVSVLDALFHCGAHPEVFLHPQVALV